MKKSNLKAFPKVFGQWLCIWSLIPEYEEGKIYPSVGWNNGTHIIGLGKNGDPFDGLGWNTDDGTNNIVYLYPGDEDVPTNEFGDSAEFMEVKS